MTWSAFAVGSLALTQSWGSFGIGFSFVARSPVVAFDDAVDGLLDSLRGRRLVDILAYGISALADHGMVWFLVGVSRRHEDQGRRRRASFAVIYTGLVTPVVNLAVKRLVDRDRPSGSDSGHPLPVRIPKTSSFPSGHTLSAWCAAALLVEDRRSAAGCYGMAALVSWSRVHARQHHGSDVVGGAVIGWMLGVAGRRVARALGLGVPAVGVPAGGASHPIAGTRRSPGRSRGASGVQREGP